MTDAGSRFGGFTLVEVLVAVAIVGILAAIALPSYKSQVVRSRRNAAEGCLLEVAQNMERYYSKNLSYASATLPTGGCVSDTSATYTYGFATSEPTSSTFKIEATPAGSQSPEAQCGTLSITHAGTRGQSAGTTAVCWPK